MMQNANRKNIEKGLGSWVSERGGGGVEKKIFGFIKYVRKVNWTVNRF